MLQEKSSNGHSPIGAFIIFVLVHLKHDLNNFSDISEAQLSKVILSIPKFRNHLVHRNLMIPKLVTS